MPVAYLCPRCPYRCAPYPLVRRGCALLTPPPLALLEQCFAQSSRSTAHRARAPTRVASKVNALARTLLSLLPRSLLCTHNHKLIAVHPRSTAAGTGSVCWPQTRSLHQLRASPVSPLPLAAACCRSSNSHALLLLLLPLLLFLLFLLFLPLPRSLQPVPPHVLNLHSLPPLARRTAPLPLAALAGTRQRW